MSETEKQTSGCNGENEDESKFIGVVVHVENGPQILFADLDGNSTIGELFISNRLKNCELYFGDFVVEGTKAAIHKIASLEKNYYLIHAKYISNVKKDASISYDPSKKCLISIKGRHGKWLCAESNGTAICNRPHCKIWEQFWSIPLGNNKIGLLSYHKKYLSAQPNGTLEQNRNKLLQWEIFTVIQKNNRFGFKSCHNKYLSAQPNGEIQVNRSNLCDWELFEIDVIKNINCNYKVEQKIDSENKMLADGNYRLVAAHSHKSLDVEGDSKKAHGKIIQWDSHNGKNQIFSIRKQHSNYYTIQCVNSGLYWDICTGTKNNGAKLIQFGYHGKANQLFEFVYYGDNKWYIKAKHSGKILDIEGGTKKNGANVIQWDAHYKSNQLFYCKIQK